MKLILATMLVVAVACVQVAQSSEVWTAGGIEDDVQERLARLLSTMVRHRHLPRVVLYQAKV